MSIQHVDIVDPHIHEPKGISSASVGTVYVASGSGSGSWSIVPADSIDIVEVLSRIQAKLNDGTLAVTGSVLLTGVLPDISTAGSVIVPLPDDCTVLGVTFVLSGSITDADAAISVKNSAGAGLGTNVTVPFSGSAKGNQFAFTATGNNVITGPSWIEIATDGASTGTVPVYFTVSVSMTINPEA